MTDMPWDSPVGDAMNTGPEIREDYDHLAAAKQMLGIYYDGLKIGHDPRNHDRLLEIIAESLIALADVFNGVPRTVHYEQEHQTI